MDRDREVRVVREVRAKLNNWIYWICYIVIISWSIEYTTKFYTRYQITQAFLSYTKAGVSSLEIYGLRCSGTYYFDSELELEYRIKFWEKYRGVFSKPVEVEDYKAMFNSFGFGFSTIDKDNVLESGFQIACSPGHANFIKGIKFGSYDDPQPAHITVQNGSKGELSNY